MKVFRIIICAIFIIAAGLTIRYLILAKAAADETVPVIKLETDTLEVSLHPTDEELLKGVSAYDEKDGDITGQVLVESISRFTEKGVSMVTYTVSDSNNHVAEATRTIIYKDYESPKFTLNHPLIFAPNEASRLREFIGAEDVLDGDISDRVIFNSSNYNPAQEGAYQVSLQVSNSKGDTIYAVLPIAVASVTTNDPEIFLSKYIITLKEGSSFNPNEFVMSASDVHGNQIPKEYVQCESYVKTGEPGTYYADYFVYDEAERLGRSRLIVIVEEKEEVKEN